VEPKLSESNAKAPVQLRSRERLATGEEENDNEKGVKPVKRQRAMQNVENNLGCPNYLRINSGKD
jgi:hypothetical protein